jgi:hypothetical protein
MFNEGANTLCIVALAIFKMKEEELIRTKHVGEVMKVLHDATDHAYNPDELLTVPLFFSCFLSRDSWVPTYTQLWNYIESLSLPSFLKDFVVSGTTHLLENLMSWEIQKLLPDGYWFDTSSAKLALNFWDQVAFDKVKVMSSQTISKQRKKEQLEVMAELERRVQRLNSGDQDSGSSGSQKVMSAH